MAYNRSNRKENLPYLPGYSFTDPRVSVNTCPCTICLLATTTRGAVRKMVEEKEEEEWEEEGERRRTRRSRGRRSRSAATVGKGVQRPCFRV
jgi:hypothetical protein